jgi:hypothetical protein
VEGQTEKPLATLDDSLMSLDESLEGVLTELINTVHAHLLAQNLHSC